MPNKIPQGRLPISLVEVLQKRGRHGWVPLREHLASCGIDVRKTSIELHEDPGVIVIDIPGSETRHIACGDWRLTPEKK